MTMTKKTSKGLEDPVRFLQEQVAALEKKLKAIEESTTDRMNFLEKTIKSQEHQMAMTERWRNRDIEQMKKLLDIWTTRGKKS